MIIFVPVSKFDHKPERCPFGHSLWPGMAEVGWQPCICTAAREAAERGRGMGHLWVPVTPATASFGRRRSTSRRMTSTTTNPAPGEQTRPPGTLLLTLECQAGEQLLRELNERANLRLLGYVDLGKPGYIPGSYIPGSVV